LPVGKLSPTRSRWVTPIHRTSTNLLRGVDLFQSAPLESKIRFTGSLTTRRHEQSTPVHMGLWEGNERHFHMGIVNQSETGSDINQAERHEDYLHRLGQLAERWRSQHEADLELRHDTGAVLNTRIGPPTERQMRGAEVLKVAAKELGTTESELSRMRRFAHHFPLLNDLRVSHPDVATWTAVKELLPALKPKGQATGQAKKGAAKSTKRKSRKATKLREIKQCLGKLATNLKKIPPDLSDAEKTSLLDQFRDVAKVFQEHLKIQLPTYQMPAETAPLAA
jgi:hypothetical protein